MQGVTKRDQIVFTEVRNRGIPIFMVTSGGYQVYYLYICTYMHIHHLEKVLNNCYLNSYVIYACDIKSFLYFSLTRETMLV